MQIKSTSESDPRSYVVTKQLQIKPRKNSEAPTEFEPMVEHHTGSHGGQLSCETSLEAGQVQVQFIPVIWRE